MFEAEIFPNGRKIQWRDVSGKWFNGLYASPQFGGHAVLATSGPIRGETITISADRIRDKPHKEHA